jgi:septum site-determining protein MinD
MSSSASCIAFYSSKGGCGQTFLAVNTAVALQLESDGAGLLIDAGLPLSKDCAACLDIESVRCLTPLLEMAEIVNPELLATYPVSHSSGLNLVALSSKLQDPHLLFQKEAIQLLVTLIKKLSSQYKFTLIDTGKQFTPLTETLLDFADQIIVPFEHDPYALSRVADDLRLLQQRNFSAHIIHPVVNKKKSEKLLNPSMVKRKLSREPVCDFSFVPDLFSMISRGKTFPTDYKKHPVTMELKRLIVEIAKTERFYHKVEKTESDSGKIETSFTRQERDVLKLAVHEELIETIDLKRLNTETHDQKSYKKLEHDITTKITELLDRHSTIRDRTVRKQLVREMVQEALKLGPLEDLLDDPDITEVMVNRYSEIFIEKKGNLSKTDRRFLSEKQLLTVIERIVAPLGRRIDTSSPMVDARLRDGSRVNAVIPPLAIKGASLTIRKFSKEAMDTNQLLSKGTLNKNIADFLRAAVISKQNIVISGGTGSGKTTLLNILSSYIPDKERIITIEDSAELRLQQSNVVTLEARPINIEGAGEVTIRDLVKNSLRMRPDRIVVGECRSGEALDMLQAMNTGHDGSLTTLHANSAREALGRLETLVMFAGFELPSTAIREQIIGAIDIIVQIARLKDGSRKIIGVSEVTGMEGSVITLGDIFQFKQTEMLADGTLNGHFHSTDYVPRCLETFKEHGVAMPRELFWATD